MKPPARVIPFLQKQTPKPAPARKPSFLDQCVGGLRLDVSVKVRQSPDDPGDGTGQSK